MFVKYSEGYYVNQIRGKICGAISMFTGGEFLSTLLEEITDLHKPSIIYKDSQGTIFLAKKTKVGMRTKQIVIR